MGGGTLLRKRVSRFRIRISSNELPLERTRTFTAPPLLSSLSRGFAMPLADKILSK